MSKILFAQVTQNSVSSRWSKFSDVSVKTRASRDFLNWKGREGGTGLKPSCAKNNKKNVRITCRDTQTNYIYSTIIEQIRIVWKVSEKLKEANKEKEANRKKCWFFYYLTKKIFNRIDIK